MRTAVFEALLVLDGSETPLPSQVLLLLRDQKESASIRPYGPGPEPKTGQVFMEANVRRPLMLKWRDTFAVLDARKNAQVGRGMVLNPGLAKEEETRKAVDWDFLLSLSGDEGEMLDALCRKNGVRGLHEREIREFCNLSEESLQRLGEKLEEEGKVKILAFSPLFLISRASFDHLSGKVLAYLEKFHQLHPGQKGVLMEKIKRRFGVSEKIFLLVIRTLERAGQVTSTGTRLMMTAHQATLSAQEEKIVEQLEDMCYRGEFQSVSLGEIRSRFHLSPERLERLLSVLAERKKVVQSPDGLFIHSRWLDEVVAQVRSSGRRELTVADFKQLTGLSRKYAIPLLELLDQMKVTRRRGAVREILPGP
ncbi:MAG: SelB C-terminal domain-containing protein [Candidatus Aminicenantes bacterium]|nr:SelB C-terminal domain-containing protein [Candidatus Aminicenantes bacterium]